jgi:uncharacterized protein
LILSEDRQTHWAHILVDGVYNADLVDFTDEDQALRAAKRAIAEFMKEEVDLDNRARTKVLSLKRGVIEGSPEWDILYRKYYEEERNKRGQS